MRLTFKCDLYDLPLSFMWKAHDVDGVKRYIDALVAGRSMEARFVEESGVAYDQVYPEHDANKESITLQINDFVDFLLMRGHIELPAHRRILFVTDKGRNAFVPSEFIGAISQSDSR